MIKNNSVTFGKEFDELLELLKNNNMFTDLHSTYGIRNVCDDAQREVVELREQVEQLQNELNNIKDGDKGISNNTFVDKVTQYLETKQENINSFVKSINNKAKSTVEEFKTRGREALEGIGDFMQKSRIQFLNAAIKSEKAIFQVGMNALKKVDDTLGAIRKPVASLGNHISKKIDILQDSIHTNDNVINNISRSNNIQNEHLQI